MAEWHVSESEDEETKEGDTSNKRRDVIDSGGISIDHAKMLELLQALKTNRTLHLDCVTSHRKYERRKRKRKKEKSGMGQEMSVHSGMGGDFVSETASEMRSTHTASTGECRDTRRPTLSTFDYEHENYISLHNKQGKVKRSLPGHKPKKKMVRLDLIEAGIRREKEEEDEDHKCQEKKVDSDSNNYHYTNHDSHFQSNSVSINSCTELREKTTRLHDEIEDTAMLSKRSVNGSDSANGSLNDVAGVLLTGKRNLLKFDIGNIEDSDQESMSSDHDTSTKDILSQINRIEQFLDQDGLF